MGIDRAIDLVLIRNHNRMFAVRSQESLSRVVAVVAVMLTSKMTFAHAVSAESSYRSTHAIRVTHGTSGHMVHILQYFPLNSPTDEEMLWLFGSRLIHC